MKKALLILLLCSSMAGAQTPDEKPTAAPAVTQTPLKLEVVPTFSKGGEWAVNLLDDTRSPPFHVILTNISKSNQTVYQEGNRWGWQNLSFEFRTADGTTHITTKKPISFPENYPDTFLILPGEHKVFPVQLNPSRWETRPGLKENGDFPVTFKAIYRISKLRGGASGVWIGHIESREYKLTIRHFESEPDKGASKKSGLR